MNRRRLLFFLLFPLALASAHGMSLRDRLLTGPEVPTGCIAVSGIYPAGVRTSMLYDYKRYSGAMPPLVQKMAQSFNCGGVRGSLLFFEYGSSDARDQAELFAKPILSREEDLLNPIEVREWATGFVVISFKVPSSALNAALEKKLAPGSETPNVASPAAPPAPASAPNPFPPSTPPPVKVPKENISAVQSEGTPSSEDASFTQLNSPRLRAASVPRTANNVLPALSPAPASVPMGEPGALSSGAAGHPFSGSALDQMAMPKPSGAVSTEPPMDSAHALTTPAPAPPNLPAKAMTSVAPPRVATPPAFSERRPHNAPRQQTPAAATAPIGPVVASLPAAIAPLPLVVSHPANVGPPASLPPALPRPPPMFHTAPRHPGAGPVSALTEVSDSVIANFAEKLDCANPDLKEQSKIVCTLLDDFKNGTKPTLPQGVAEFVLGAVYTVDEYGRLIDQHDDVLAGADWVGYASFFALVSTNGQEDFEIQSLIDARKAQKPLPSNRTLALIRSLSAKKRFPAVPTTGLSTVILPGGARRVYIRMTGTHWVLFGPQGATPDEQIRGNVVLAELY